MTALLLAVALAGFPAGDEYFAPTASEMAAAAQPFERMLVMLAGGQQLADPGNRLAPAQRHQIVDAIAEARRQDVFVRVGVAPGRGAASRPLVPQEANWLGILNFNEVLLVADDEGFWASPCPKGSPYLLRSEIEELLKPHQPSDIAGAVVALRDHMVDRRVKVVARNRLVWGAFAFGIVALAVTGLWLSRARETREHLDASRSAPQRSASLTWRAGAGLIALLLAAAVLRVWFINTESFWVDEEWARANGSQPTPLKVAQIVWIGDNHPPLYYLLVHGWMKLAGDSDVAVRGLSLVCGLALVAIGFFVGRAWWGSRAGWWIAALLAVMPQAVYFSQEARMYALLGVCVLATFAVLGWFLARPGARRGLALALTMTITLYTHYYGMFVVTAALATAAALWLVGATSRRDFGRLLLWSSFALVLFLPWFGHFVERLSNKDNVSYLMQVPTWQNGLRALAGPCFVGRLGIKLVVVFLAATALAVFVACSRRRRGENDPSAAALSLAMWVLPIGLLWMQAQFGAAWLHERLVMLVAPGLAVVLGAAVAGLQARFASLAAGVALMALCLVQMPRLHAEFPHEAWRDAASFVSGNFRASDAVYVDPSNRIVERMWRRYSENRLPLRTMPLLADASFVDRSLPNAGRLWVVASTTGIEKSELVLALERSPQWRRVQDRRLPFVRVHCFEKTHQRPESGS